MNFLIPALLALVVVVGVMWKSGSFRDVERSDEE